MNGGEFSDDEIAREFDRIARQVEHDASDSDGAYATVAALPSTVQR